MLMKEYRTVIPLIFHPSTPSQICQEKNANQISHGIVPSTKIIKLKAVKLSSFIQKKKDKAKRKKTNFKKMVRNCNSSNSDINNDSD